MTKVELIQTVRELNSTASVEFLTQFNEVELEEYVDHLLEVDTVELTAAAAPPIPYN